LDPAGPGVDPGAPVPGLREEDTMTSRQRTRLAALAAAISALGLAPGAQAQEEATAWNLSPEPTALYGHCGQEDSAMGSKLYILDGSGIAPTDVAAIKILACREFDGPGNIFDAPCPAGSAYDFCKITHNDGRGNMAKFGVLLAGPRTDPNARYEGCPDGADTQPKIDRLLDAGQDPRTTNGLVTVSCAAAAGAAPHASTSGPCPGGKGPFAYCVSTPNDGHGNAVTIGVIRTAGTGDPAGLYGRCDSGVGQAFASKLSLLAGLGKPTANVRAIDLLNCQVPGGYGGGFPRQLVAGDCHDSLWVNGEVVDRYDYCIWGTDARGMGLVLGVNAK
jgi:hypothetical protein